MVLHLNHAGDCRFTETSLEGVTSRGEDSEMKVSDFIISSCCLSSMELSF